MWHSLLHFLGLDSASGAAYLAWSGVLSDIGELVLIGGLYAFVRRHNCQVNRCWRLGRHMTAAGHFACRRHSPLPAPTHAEVIDAHRNALNNQPDAPKKERLANPDQGGIMSLKCHFDSSGWLQGPIRITHLFTPNHGAGFGTGRGVVLHTEAGFEGGTVDTFMNPASQVSAFFSIAQDGSCHQYLPVGKGYVAWTQVAGNHAWRGIEDEDRTHPSIPLTDAQITTFAQILEACSEFDGFPLQITDSPSGQGLILHSDGGQDWGGHLSCPGPVRAAQRPAIIALAKQIRAGAPPGPTVKTWVSRGQMTLHDLAALHLGRPVSDVLRITLANSPGQVFAADLARHVDAVFAGDQEACPAGVTLHWTGGQWQTKGMLPLNALASTQLHDPVHQVVALTAASPQGFGASGTGYVNAVFARTAIKPAPGTVFRY
jgi:N-acetylmuramoyl-L-alanine amidase